MNLPAQMPHISPHLSPRLSPRLCLLAAAAVLAGCASVSPDGLRGNVANLAAGRTGGVQASLPAADPAARASAAKSVEGWLAQPLTQDAAVRIALLHNPGLQARLAALGVADAERVQAITLPNPHLALGRFTNSHEREIERTLAFSLIDLITLPWRTARQAERLQIATLQAAQDVVTLAADTRRAWLRAVAAEQIAATHDRMVEAAEAGAELARRMVQVGNWSRLQQAREQAVLQEATRQRARARLEDRQHTGQPVQRTLHQHRDRLRLDLYAAPDYRTGNTHLPVHRHRGDGDGRHEPGDADRLHRGRGTIRELRRSRHCPCLGL